MVQPTRLFPPRSIVHSPQVVHHLISAIPPLDHLARELGVRDGLPPMPTRSTLPSFRFFSAQYSSVDCSLSPT